jgi:hypothetical protein
VTKKGITGPPSLFRRKLRAQPISVTFTRRHHQKLKAATERLDLSRSDVLGLLVDLYADTVRIPYDLVVHDET